MKNNKGFSLVELIIVIAIMAVLIGVMAPQYIKYVEKSRISTDDDNAAEVLGAVTTALSDETVNAKLSAQNYMVTWDTNGNITASGVAELDAEVKDTLGATSIDRKSTKYKASTYQVSIVYTAGTGFHAYGSWQ